MGHRAVYIFRGNKNQSEKNIYRVFYCHWAMPHESIPSLMNTIYSSNSIDDDFKLGLFNSKEQLGVRKSLNAALKLCKQGDLEMVYLIDYVEESFTVYFSTIGTSEEIYKRQDTSILKWWDYKQREIDLLNREFQSLAWVFQNQK